MEVFFALDVKNNWCYSSCSKCCAQVYEDQNKILKCPKYAQEVKMVVTRQDNITLLFDWYNSIYSLRSFLSFILYFFTHIKKDRIFRL